MTYTRAEAAKRADVAPDYVDRLLDLGILALPAGDVYTKGDVRRLALVQMLERAGLPIDGIAAAIAQGHLSLDFLDVESYDRFGVSTDTTFAELSASTGIPLELLMIVREATGYAEPEPTDFVRENDLRIVPLVEAQLRLGFRPAAIVGWLRVYGEAIRRVTETEVDWWHNEVELRMLESGMSPDEMMRRSDAEVAPVLAPLLDDVILGIYHGQQMHGWQSSMIFGIEQALERGGVYSRLKHPPAICFLDLTGYTQLTQEHGDRAAAETAERLGRVVRRSSAQHGGKPIKWLGDGVMFHFPEPGAGTQAALEMVAEAKAAGLPPAHVGLHAGPVLFQEGDYFGQTVNLASRIADYARPGEVLVSREVVDAADGLDIAFTAIGPVDLKGVSGAVELYAAHSGEARAGKP